MGIQREQSEAVLCSRGGDPHVVDRDGGALLSKIVPDGRVTDSRLLVQMQNADSRFCGEFTQTGLVLSPAPTLQEGSLELAHGHHTEVDHEACLTGSWRSGWPPV